MALSEAAYVLSQRYEDRLFAPQGTASKVIPVVVITGFLGTGKTTLVRHLLLNGSQLRLGVLVNEAGTIDIDSHLLNTAQANAAVGVPSAPLAGGCACCALGEPLEAALAAIRNSTTGRDLDCLLLETSGVADAEPLAGALGRAGLRLSCVVTLVDAEQGLAALEHEVAVAQVRAADVVVLNKCDLVSLGAVADVEDRVQQLAPGVRMLRARWGQIPPEAVFDLPVEDMTCTSTPVTAVDGDGGSSSSSAAAGVRGEVAFLSHEATFAAPRLRAGSSSTAARVPKLLQRDTQQANGDKAPGGADDAVNGSSAVPHGSGGNHHHHGHEGHSHMQQQQHHHPQQQQQQQQQQGRPVASSHSHFHEVPFAAAEALCMAAFCGWVVDQLRVATGVFRAKGFLSFSQAPGAVYTLHLSGKQRIDCTTTATSSSTASSIAGDSVCINSRDGSSQQVQGVLIGSHLEQLQQLAAGLEACLSSRCPGCCRQAPGPAGKEVPTAHTSSSREGGCAAAQRLQQLLQEDPRLELVAPAAAAAGPGLVSFSAVGSVLHGIDAHQVNAALVRLLNASGRLFLPAVLAPPTLATTSTGTQVVHTGVSALQACWHGDEAGGAGDVLWGQLMEAGGPLLRSTYAHVNHCKCDVVQAVQLSASDYQRGGAASSGAV